MGANYGYYDTYPFQDSGSLGMGLEGIAGFSAFFVFIALFYLVTFGLSIAAYVLQSLGNYTIAKRRGIRNPWLAWVPIGSLWILGSISDQYQYFVKGRVCNRRKILLGLSIGSFASLIPMFVFLIMGLIAASEEILTVTLMIAALTILLTSVLEIIMLVYSYISLYDLFMSCEPNNAVAYLVLSVLFSISLPFFVFFCRKKDLGMPPRKAVSQIEDVPAVDPEQTQQAEHSEEQS